MNEILAGVIGAVAAAAGIGIGAGVVRWVRLRVHLTGPTAEAVESQAKQLATQRALVFMLAQIQKPQLVALLGLLEAHRKEMNGNFERAHNALRTALDTFDETLVKIARGECKEPKE